MFILLDLLQPLQAHFSETDLGRERASLLILYAPVCHLILHVVQFTVLPETLFGIEIKMKRFYTFMASSTLP